jgi:hypothetical protein
VALRIDAQDLERAAVLARAMSEREGIKVTRTGVLRMWIEKGAKGVTTKGRKA